jgi:hypothetical protein
MAFADDLLILSESQVELELILNAIGAVLSSISKSLK